MRKSKCEFKKSKTRAKKVVDPVMSLEQNLKFSFNGKRKKKEETRKSKCEFKKSKIRAKKVVDPVMSSEKVSTRLLQKTYSPLLVRKYQAFGWPLYIGIICDVSLSDLDTKVYEGINIAKINNLVSNDIQSIRNFCGFLSEYLVSEYNNVKTGCVEGISVLAYWDKCFCSSLYGDFMTHLSCKSELYSIIQTLPHI